MKRPCVIIGLISIIIVLSQKQIVGYSFPKDNTIHEEYIVYGRLVDESLLRGSKITFERTTLSKNQTTVPRRLISDTETIETINFCRAYFQKTRIPLEESTLEDFFQKNSDTHLLEDSFAFKSKVLRTTTSNRFIFVSETSTDTFTKYFYACTRVGFNAFINQALLYCNHSSAGYFHLLEKREGKWQLRRRCIIWEY